MISFTILTDTPGRLRDFLLDRGIIQEVIDPESGQPHLEGVRKGMEWVNVPNPIVITPAEYGPPDGEGRPTIITPAVMDDRKVFLVKFAHESEADTVEGIDQGDRDNPKNILQRTKFGQWIINNSVSDPVDVNGTILPARRVGANTWVTLDEPGLLGAWQ